MLINVVKVFIPTAFAFFFGLALTPLATHFFYEYKMWKKHSRSIETGSQFKTIHNEHEELNTPRVGGILIWFSAALVTFLFYIAAILIPSDQNTKMNFLSRNQTVIPFFTLLFGAVLGLWDDCIQIFGKGRFARDDTSWRIWKASMVVLASLVVGWWFFYKLGMTSIHIPFGGSIYLGVLIIPFFALVSLAIWSGGVIDGIDGLSGGVFASIFASYSAIAFANNQIDLAAFSGVITGAILAFLWFNIPPARFYMGETGMMALTMTLTTLAFLTDSVLILPIVAMLLVITSLSVIIQLLSKKFRGGKRVFLLAPLHHHFEAASWPSYKVTMRFWVLSVVFSILGIILAIVSR